MKRMQPWLLRVYTPPKINSLPLKNDGSKSTFLLVRSLLKGRTHKFQGYNNGRFKQITRFFPPTFRWGSKTKLQPVFSFRLDLERKSQTNHQLHPHEAPNDADGVPEGVSFSLQDLDTWLLTIWLRGALT